MNHNDAIISSWIIHSAIQSLVILMGLTINTRCEHLRNALCGLSCRMKFSERTLDAEAYSTINLVSWLGLSKASHLL